MAKLDHLALLEELTRLSAYSETTEEGHFSTGFHVVPEHLKAFDPTVLLVLGNRGCGKSYLFQAVTRHGLAGDLRRLVPTARIPAAAHWVEGFTNEGKGRPDTATLISHFKKEPRAAQDFWLAALVRSLQPLLQGAGQPCDELWRLPGARLGQWLEFVAEHGEAVTEVLDHLDDLLQQKQEVVFVGYDELDTLLDDDPARSGHALVGLIAFWARFHRRWKVLRPKLFLRTDLYRKFSTQGGADLAKLSANRVEIRWSDLALHGVLCKQILNLPDPGWGTFLGLKPTREDPRLGKLLEQRQPVDFKPAYQALIGEYMGEGPRKGLAFRWPIEHVRDGLGTAHPRAMVELFRIAAERQRSTGRLPPRLPGDPPGRGTRQTLLQPFHLRRALSDVSRIHVDHVGDVWSWMEQFRQLTSGRQTPTEREAWTELLEASWARWAVPPNRDPESFLDELLDIGVLRTRPDGRIDASDLYLDGLGLRRKGGVRRK